MAEDGAGKARGIMSNDVVLQQKIASQNAQTQPFKFNDGWRHRFGTPAPIAPQRARRNYRAIDNGPVEEVQVGVLINCPYVIRDRISLGLARLGHQVGNVDARGFGAANRGGHAVHQKVGNNAGIKRARTDQN